jgi:membrane-bound lytic murein transglycosylase A
VTDRGVEREGLFTGYYEPELRGSRRRHGPYQTPLYREPGDLIQVDLGAFREDLEGRRIAGRIVGGRLEPYHDRRSIDRGALAGRDLELVWVDDPVDAFFLQVQGSGRIVLEDGTVLRVGYDAQNGHPYTAIGRELVERGEMPLEEVSLQSIRRWLEAHPEEAPDLMATNASYVFFRMLGGAGPLGSLGVPLTPGRSVAVDPRFLPLGAPVWLAGSMPALPDEVASGPSTEPTEPIGSLPLRRLLVAQDTGGAIRGPVRGDVFWGAGERAEAVAGRMKHPGRLWLLLPTDPTGASSGLADHPSTEQ